MPTTNNHTKKQTNHSAQQLFKQIPKRRDHIAQQGHSPSPPERERNKKITRNRLPCPPPDSGEQRERKLSKKTKTTHSPFFPFFAVDFFFPVDFLPSAVAAGFLAATADPPPPPPDCPPDFSSVHHVPEDFDGVERVPGIVGF